MKLTIKETQSRKSKCTKEESDKRSPKKLEVLGPNYQ